jgi:hypothetical protein
VPDGFHADDHRRRNSNPQLSINSNAGGADRADSEIYGVSDKVLAMALSALLLGASDVEQLFTSLRNQAMRARLPHMPRPPPIKKAVSQVVA